jgi:DNA-binding NarL/FixJ family response regulator
MRILLLEDDVDLAGILATGLRAESYAVDVATTAGAATRLLATTRYDVACIDLGLPDGDGLELIRRLRAGALESHLESPERILVTTASDAVDHRVAGLDAGADDYIVKPFAPDELLTRVRHLVRRSQPSLPSNPGNLTKREREVLQLLAEGLRQDDIAERLFISRKTVGSHVANILRKLGVRTQAQAVAVAYRDELTDVRP